MKHFRLALSISFLVLRLRLVQEPNIDHRPKPRNGGCKYELHPVPYSFLRRTN